MFRKKVMPEVLVPAWEVFQAQAERVDQARSALVSCLSFGRGERGPIPVGLDLLDDELSEVSKEVDAWRRPEIERHWVECAESLDVTREQIPVAREAVGRTDDGGQLVIVVRNCVTPLDAWYDAERAWLALRVKA